MNLTLGLHQGHPLHPEKLHVLAFFTHRFLMKRFAMIFFPAVDGEIGDFSGVRSEVSSFEFGGQGVEAQGVFARRCVWIHNRPQPLGV